MDCIRGFSHLSTIKSAFTTQIRIHPFTHSQQDLIIRSSKTHIHRPVDQPLGAIWGFGILPKDTLLHLSLVSSLSRHLSGSKMEVFKVYFEISVLCLVASQSCDYFTEENKP